MDRGACGLQSMRSQGWTRLRMTQPRLYCSWQHTRHEATSGPAKEVSGMLRKQSHGLKRNPQWKQLCAIISYRALVLDRKALREGLPFDRLPESSVWRVSAGLLSRLLQSGQAWHLTTFSWPHCFRLCGRFLRSLCQRNCWPNSPIFGLSRKRPQRVYSWRGAPLDSRKLGQTARSPGGHFLCGRTGASDLLPLKAPPQPHSLLYPFLEQMFCHLSDQRTDLSKRQQMLWSIQVWKSCWSV